MNLTVHNVYFCFSEVGCTISLRDGTPCKEVPAMHPTLFVAQQPDMVCSDPAAVVKEIPNGLQLLHGQMMKEQVPAWYAPLKAELTALLDGSKFELAWLASKNTLVVHTDRISDELGDAVTALLERVVPQNVEVVSYNHNMEISWREINKYAECVTEADVKAVNPDYKKDLTSDGAWIYPMPKLKSEFALFRYADALTKFCVDLPSLTTSNGLLQYTSITEFDRKFPLLKRWWGTFEGSTKLVRFLSDISHVENGGYTFNTCLSLEVFESDLPKLSYGSAMFHRTMLNKESALRILNSIPAYTSGSYPLTIGIHIDHKTDDEVLEAIAAAEAKGWTLTVQWNGTPTAQAATTYGLRKPPIYARVSEHDGERYLDWGHYVTDTSGYEEFRSVEAAREYYGLPDESLTETE